MLEILDILEEEQDENQRQNMIRLHFQKYPGIDNLFLTYYYNQDNIIIPSKILKMMRYFGVEDRKYLQEIGEIGDYAVEKMNEIRDREYKRFGADPENIPEVKNCNHMIIAMNRLKKNITHRNQYNTLKQALNVMSDTDIKWFVRMLCNKVEVPQDIKNELNIE